MADVPDQPVARRVEHVVQRHGQLDHAEPGAEMAAGDRDRIDRLGAQLVRQLAQASGGRRRRSAGSSIVSSNGVSTMGSNFLPAQPVRSAGLRSSAHAT